MSSKPETKPGLDYVVKGDWGAGSEQQEAVSLAMCQLFDAKHFEAVITTGDNFYKPDGRASKDNFYSPESCLIDRQVTYMPAWGNHDGRDADTAKVLAAPGRYYSWSSGDGDVDFFALDSNPSISSEQKQWLEDGLAGSAATFQIAYFHHPPFTVGSAHSPDLGVQRAFWSRLRDGGVDLVMTGHNHLYERWVVDGVDYVVSGGGGKSLYRCSGTDEDLILCTEKYHFLHLNVNDDVLTLQAVGIDGVPFDEVEISPR